MTEKISFELAKYLAETALDQQAHDVNLLDLRPLNGVADFFVICHGDVDVHVKAIAEGVLDGAWKEGVKVWHKEGLDYGHWVLLDFVDVVVHVFLEETREFYGLERLWGDAEVESLSE